MHGVVELQLTHSSRSVFAVDDVDVERSERRNVKMSNTLIDEDNHGETSKSKTHLVDNKNTGIVGSLVNSSINACRSLTAVEPSKRRNLISKDSMRLFMRSNTRVHWLKISMRWPPLINCGRSVRSRTNFDEQNKSSTARVYFSKNSLRFGFSSIIVSARMRISMEKSQSDPMIGRKF